MSNFFAAADPSSPASSASSASASASASGNPLSLSSRTSTYDDLAGGSEFEISRESKRLRTKERLVDDEDELEYRPPYHHVCYYSKVQLCVGLELLLIYGFCFCLLL